MDNALPRRSLLRLGGLAGGALVAGAVGSNLVAPSQVAAAGPFTLNGFTVDEPFATYWQAHGGLEQQGLPISPRFDEVSPTNGRTYAVQYFERARFEFHPENQPPYDVLLGLLGSEQFKAKYPNGGPSAPPPPPPPLRNGETLRVEGANLTVTMQRDMYFNMIFSDFVYTNTSDSQQDFTTTEDNIKFSDDVGGVWQVRPGDFAAKRYILNPGEQVKLSNQAFRCTTSLDNDRNLLFTVIQFGNVRNASWTARFSQGQIK